MPQGEKVISIKHVYEVRPRKDHRGFDLICDVLPFGRLWFGGPDATTNAIRYVKSIQEIRTILSICVCDAYGNVTQTHHLGRVQEAAGVSHEQPLGQPTITRRKVDKNAGGRDTK
jgi:hypothetical protein